jgi:hypothetical protein
VSRFAERDGFYAALRAGMASVLETPIEAAAGDGNLRDKIEATATLFGVRGLVIEGLWALGIVGNNDRQQARHLCAKQAQLHSMLTMEVVTRLQRAGVQTLALKGVAADERYWGGRGLRMGTDVDVWVNDANAATAALLSFTTASPFEAALPRSAATRVASTLPCKIFGIDVNVDVHRSLLGPTMHDFATAAWHRRIATRSGVPMLDDADAIVYAADNALGEGFDRWHKLAVDVVAIVHRNPAALTIATSLAREAGCAAALSALLSLSARFLGLRHSQTTTIATRLRARTIETLHARGTTSAIINLVGSDHAWRSARYWIQHGPKLWRDLRS